ncbi:MAG TPA: ABC transporter ATP-binding protein, partial [Reyranella sp.]|nr:ABC transporter ATP-binding protein [Reyranella sp.]
MSVEFRNVVKRYGTATAVAGISFTVDSGTLVTLLGPSGCGKTTTLRMIAGLELPSEGRIVIAGRDVTSLGATERDVSMVFQSYALFPHMSVLENVCYGLRRSGQSKAAAEKRALEGLAQVGLEGYGARQPSELSGGQQQRVAVARALVLKPSVLLFDEPLSNLDARLRRQMREEIRELQQRLGLTVVYVTHDQQEAMAVSDRIIVMNAGRIEQQGAPRDLYEQPATPFLARFMGESNPARGRIQRLDPQRVRVQVG